MVVGALLFSKKERWCSRLEGGCSALAVYEEERRA
jgi:hypothetical protein